MLLCAITPTVAQAYDADLASSFLEQAAASDGVVHGVVQSNGADSLTIDGVTYGMVDGEPGSLLPIGTYAVAFHAGGQIHRNTLTAIEKADLDIVLTFYENTEAMALMTHPSGPSLDGVALAASSGTLPRSLDFLVLPLLSKYWNEHTHDWVLENLTFAGVSPSLKVWSLEYLRTNGDASDLSIVETHLYDDDPGVVLHALAALRWLGGDPIEMEWLLTDSRQAIRRAAAHTYGAIGTSAQPLLDSYDASADILDRITWIESLQLLPEPERTLGLAEIYLLESDPFILNVLSSEIP